MVVLIQMKFLKCSSKEVVWEEEWTWEEWEVKDFLASNLVVCQDKANKDNVETVDNSRISVSESLSKVDINNFKFNNKF